MYKLFYKPGACSMAVHVLLNEIGVPFTGILQDDLKAPEFVALNPRGQVPLLIVNDEPVKEGGALLSWLADEHQSPLLPRAGLKRAKTLEWLMWCNASLHPAAGRLFWLAKQPGLDDATKDTLRKVMLADLQKLWDEADTRLGKTPYLAGDEVSVADILLTVIANWNLGVTLGPNVKRVLKDVSQRPAYQKTLKTENIEYKAAA